MKYLKLIAIFLLVIVIANLIFFAAGRISPYLFWFVIIGSALIAYYVIPNIKKQQVLNK